MAIYLEELENLRPIRCGNSRDLEQFADILDTTIINLKGNEKCGKMPEIMLTQYQRWIYGKTRRPSVKTPREWIIMESEYQSKIK